MKKYCRISSLLLTSKDYNALNSLNNKLGTEKYDLAGSISKAVHCALFFLEAEEKGIEIFKKKDGEYEKVILQNNSPL